MAQVSIADVDNLREAFFAISHAYSSAQETTENDIAELKTLSDEASADYTDAAAGLESASNAVLSLETQMQQLEEDLSQAQERLEYARQDLADAQAALENAKDEESWRDYSDEGEISGNDDDHNAD